MSVVTINRKDLNRMLEAAAKEVDMPVDQAIHNVNAGTIQGPVSDEIRFLVAMRTPPRQARGRQRLGRARR